MTVNSILIIFIIFGVKLSLAEVYARAELKDLGESLKCAYNKNVLPSHKPTQPVKVAVGFRLDSIRDILDEGLRDIEVTGWLTLSWKDSRLRWNPKKHDGIDVLRMDVKYLWKPNVSRNNGADLKSEHASIYPTGKVVWIPRSNLTASCVHKPTYYPLDTLNCSLKFGNSWVYDGAHLDVELYENKAQFDLSDMSGSNKWRVVSTSIKKTTKKYECCEEPHPDVTFRLNLERKPSRIQEAILFPYSSAYLLALIAFCNAPFRQLRLFINAFIAIMLLLSLFYLQPPFPIVARNSPAIVFSSETMILMAVLSTVWSLILMSLNRGHLCKCRPPRWVQWLTHLCMKQKCFKNDLDRLPDYHNVVDIATENKNVWMAFFLFIDRLVHLLFYCVLFSQLCMFTFQTFV